MRICPRCNERFDDASRFCPLDGEPLPVDGDDARIGSTLLGQFELLEVCGKGAMGTVYRAWQTGMERQVAIKVLRPELMRDPKTVARFDREARAVAKLQHPNIVTFFLVGHTDEGLPFLAMEYVEGASLAAVAEHDPVMPVPRVLHIARQITSALSEAHAEGIVHRDLKPANILLTDRRRMPDFVKVLDFGIAKILGGEADAREDLESRLTRTGAIFGTPHYISPEQAQGGEVDHRADLYSLGVILYRLLTGRLPFDGTGINVLLAHIGQPVTPPSDLIAGFDPRIEKIILRALEKDPADRFASAEEMADALDAAGAVRVSRSGEALDPTAVLEPTPDSVPIVVVSGSSERKGAVQSSAARNRTAPGSVPAVVPPKSPTPTPLPRVVPPSESSLSTQASEISPTPPPRASRRFAVVGASLGLLLVAGGIGASVVWLDRKSHATAEPLPPVAAPVTVPAPPPLTPPPVPPPPAPVVKPPVGLRTITLGEVGYAIRIQVPRLPRVNLAYTLVMDVLDPTGAPLALPRLPMSFEDAGGREIDAEATLEAPGRYELARTFTVAGQQHIHVYPDGAARKLHIWFDLFIADATGKVPDPPAPKPAPKPAPRVKPAPAPAPPVVVGAPPAETPPPAPILAPPPAPTPEAPVAHEGAAESDPYHDSVIPDDDLKEPLITPPPAETPPPRVKEGTAQRPRVRIPKVRRRRAGGDGLE